MSNRQQILLLEDDTFDVIVLQRSFKAAHIDAELVVASDGLEALEALGLTPSLPDITLTPALVLLDINVPRHSGFDVCRAIRQSPKHNALHIVFFSGSRSTEDQTAASEAGANAFFDKNNGPDDLITHLKTILKAI